MSDLPSCFHFSQPAIDFFSNEVMIHPVTNRPEDKRSFIPSLIEKEKASAPASVLSSKPLFLISQLLM